MPSLYFQCLTHLPHANHRLEQARRGFHLLSSIRGLKYISYVQQNDYSFNCNISKPIYSIRLHTP